MRTNLRTSAQTGFDLLRRHNPQTVHAFSGNPHEFRPELFSPLIKFDGKNIELTHMQQARYTVNIPEDLYSLVHVDKGQVKRDICNLPGIELRQLLRNLSLQCFMCRFPRGLTAVPTNKGEEGT